MVIVGGILWLLFWLGILLYARPGGIFVGVAITAGADEFRVTIAGREFFIVKEEKSRINLVLFVFELIMGSVFRNFREN